MVRFRRRRIRPTDKGSFLDHLIPPYLRTRRKKGGPNLEEGGVPVEPNKPKNLSGGAAAALEFDED